MQPAALLSALALLLLLLPRVVVAEADVLAVECPVVTVAEGQMRGRLVQRVTDDGVNISFCHFLGIPYALPPLGSLRFQAPVKYGSWNGVRNATEFGPSCIQKSLSTGEVSGSEDCLYLNVFTLHAALVHPSRALRPVINYMHAGVFAMGNGNMQTNRPDPLVHDLVFVAANSRLGPMGYLSTEDSKAPGNAGLLDQVMVLKWIRRNIAAFGGDPDRVTLLGESSGAACAHYHMLSPLSAGLFHGVIAVSGTALAPWAFEDSPRENALAMRHKFDSACEQLDPDNIVGCLQNVSATDIVDRYFDIERPPHKYYILLTGFLPTIDGVFLTDDPLTLVSKGRFANVPFVTGTTSSDALAVILICNLNDAKTWKDIDDHFEEIITWELPRGVRNTDAVKQLKEFYLDGKNISNAADDRKTLKAMEMLLTDIQFVWPAFLSAKLMSIYSPRVFVYKFSEDGLPFMKESHNMPDYDGVIHSEDMNYVFDMADEGGELLHVPSAQKPFRQRQRQLFINFATYGNPTPPGSGLTTWPPFQGEDCYVEIEAQLTKRCDENVRLIFWKELIASCGTYGFWPESPYTYGKWYV